MLSYKVTWSEEDEAYVATVDGDRFQHLRCINPDPIDALDGLWFMIATEMNV